MRRKILFITHLNPFKATFGAEQRSNLALYSFLESGFDVDVAYVGNKENCFEVQDIPDNCNIVYWNESSMKTSKYDSYKRLLLLNMFPTCRECAFTVKRLIEESDYSYIFCRYIPFAAIAGLSKYGDKLLLDIDDLPSQALQIDLSKKSLLKRVYLKAMIRAYDRDTQKWIRRSHKCFLPNKRQAEEYGTSFLPNISSIWLSEALDCNQHFINNILFVGKLDWNPNSDGINKFITQCWDDVTVRNPECKLIIGGKGLSHKLENDWLSNHNNIEILGFVSDLQEFYSLGSIVVCPIYSGAGTNIKILEALAMKKVCIVSKESTKGYESFLQHGYNCLVADTCCDFTDLISYALENPDIAQKIARQGYEDTMRLYSFEYFSKSLTSDL